MLWIGAIVWAVMYLAALAVVLIFLAGAGIANERWDEANAAFVETRSKGKPAA